MERDGLIEQSSTRAGRGQGQGFCTWASVCPNQHINGSSALGTRGSRYEERRAEQSAILDLLGCRAEGPETAWRCSSMHVYKPPTEGATWIPLPQFKASFVGRIVCPGSCNTSRREGRNLPATVRESRLQL